MFIDWEDIVTIRDCLKIAIAGFTLNRAVRLPLLTAFAAGMYTICQKCRSNPFAGETDMLKKGNESPAHGGARVT
jgi:hypothetical protein